MKKSWSIREYREGDEHQIFELDKVVWGAGVPEKERWMKGWRWMHVNNPIGTSRIWVAEHSGKVVGVHLLVVMNIKAGGKIVKGGQPIDTMTHPEYRHQGISSTLWKKLLTEAAKEGICLEFAFPTQQQYLVRMKSGWLHPCNFQLMYKPINLNNIAKYYISNRLLSRLCTIIGNFVIKLFFKAGKPTIVGGLRIIRASSFDGRINDFWKKVSADYGIILVRDKKYLNWRFVDDPNKDYTIYIAEKDGEICGYTVLRSRKADGLAIGNILDILAPVRHEEIIRSLISKAVEYFEQEKVDLIACKMVANKVYRKSYLKCGFIPHFLAKSRFIAYKGSSEISESFLKEPDNWFIQTADSPGIY